MRKPVWIARATTRSPRCIATISPGWNWLRQPAPFRSTSRNEKAAGSPDPRSAGGSRRGRLVLVERRNESQPQPDSGFRQSGAHAGGSLLQDRRSPDRVGGAGGRFREERRLDRQARLGAARAATLARSGGGGFGGVVLAAVAYVHRVSGRDH